MFRTLLAHAPEGQKANATIKTWVDEGCGQKQAFDSLPVEKTPYVPALDRGI